MQIYYYNNYESHMSDKKGALKIQILDIVALLLSSGRLQSGNAAYPGIKTR